MTTVTQVSNNATVALSPALVGIIPAVMPAGAVAIKDEQYIAPTVLPDVSAQVVIPYAIDPATGMAVPPPRGTTANFITPNAAAYPITTMPPQRSAFAAGIGTEQVTAVLTPDAGYMAVLTSVLITNACDTTADIALTGVSIYDGDLATGTQIADIALHSAANNTNVLSQTGLMLPATQNHFFTIAFNAVVPAGHAQSIFATFTQVKI